MHTIRISLYTLSNITLKFTIYSILYVKTYGIVIMKIPVEILMLWIHSILMYIGMDGYITIND